MERFKNVIADLKEQRKARIKLLKSGNQDVLAEKLEYDDAIAILEFAIKWNISSNAVVAKLPANKTSTPSSEYRIIEDHESDDRKWWTEVEVDNKAIRPLEGSLILEMLDN